MTELLANDAYTADLVPVSFYQAAMGLPVQPVEQYPAVLPFAPAMGRDGELIAAAGIDFKRTVAIGIDIDVEGAVMVGDRLSAVARKIRDEATEAGRLIDLQTEFRRDGHVVRRWTLHLLERP